MWRSSTWADLSLHTRPCFGASLRLSFSLLLHYPFTHTKCFHQPAPALDTTQPACAHPVSVNCHVVNATRGAPLMTFFQATTALPARSPSHLRLPLPPSPLPQVTATATATATGASLRSLSPPTQAPPTRPRSRLPATTPSTPTPEATASATSSRRSPWPTTTGSTFVRFQQVVGWPFQEHPADKLVGGEPIYGTGIGSEDDTVQKSGAPSATSGCTCVAQTKGTKDGSDSTVPANDTAAGSGATDQGGDSVAKTRKVSVPYPKCWQD